MRTVLTTILGAGGVIANELAAVLAAENKTFRLAGRNLKPFGDAEVVAADLSDPAALVDVHARCSTRRSDVSATRLRVNQVWHLPTTPNPPTGKQFVEMAAADFGVGPKHLVGRPLLRIGGLFDSNIRGSYEMLHQYDAPYLFDSTKFANEFDFSGTPYADGIRTAAEAYKRVQEKHVRR
jgi:nucleoside-diphosphate-sugar epimerase